MTMLAVAPPRIAVLSFDLRCATPVPSIVIGRSGSSPLQSLPNQAFNAPWQHTASTGIPIASDATARPISRGFLPWRFADAGPGARGTSFMGPASENLHSRRHSISDASPNSAAGLIFCNLSLAASRRNISLRFLTLAVTAPAHHHWCQFFIAARW